MNLFRRSPYLITNLTAKLPSNCRENPYVRCSCNNRQQINESEQNRKQSIYGFRMQWRKFLLGIWKLLEYKDWYVVGWLYSLK